MATATKAGFKEPKQFTSSRGHIRDRIIIQNSPGIPKEGQFLSLNGFAFLAKPGVEIDLPRPVRKMMDTLIITESLYDSTGKVYTRDIPRFSYQLIKEGVNLDADGNLVEVAEEVKVPASEQVATEG
jgi:hypothetical protein